MEIRVIDDSIRKAVCEMGFAIPENIPTGNCFAQYREGKLVGAAYHDAGVFPEYDSIEIHIYVAEEWRRQGIGTEMYLHLISVLDTAHFDIVSGCVWDDGKDDPALEFCRSLNAEPWQTLEYMEYSGSPFPEEIEMVPYSDEYYETLAAKKCEAWRKLAAVYGFKILPYSDRDRRLWQKDAENTFVYMHNGIPSAMGSCGADGHMHGLFVSPECKGQGLGRKIVMYCANRVFERGFKTASLSVLSKNPAKRIYSELGFVTVKSEHYFRFS